MFNDNRRTIGRFAAPARPDETPIKVQQAPGAYWLDGSGRVSAIKADGYTGDGRDYRTLAGARTAHLPQNKFGWSQAYMTSVYAYRCVNIIAGDVAKIKCGVYRKSDGVEVPSHPLMEALRWARRNQKQNIIRLWIKSLRVYGEAYIEPCFTPAGMAAGMRWLNPLVTEPEFDGFNRLLRFEYRGDNYVHWFKPDELVFDRYENLFSDYRGLTPLAVVLGEINSDRDIQRNLRSWFENDATPGGILSARQGTSVSDQEGKAILALIKEQTQGVNNRHRPIFLPEALEWQQVQQGPDQNYLAVEDGLRRRICMALDIPISTAGAWDDARYQSAPEQRKAYYEGTVEVECTRHADVINDDLMPIFDPSGACEFRYDFTDIKALIEDTKSKSELVSAQLASGRITINEAREADGKEPIPGGDALIIPGLGLVQTAALANVGQPPPAPTPAPANAAPAPAPAATNPEPQPQAGMKSACLLLDLANHPDLIGLQQRVKTLLNGAPVEWSDPAHFHVTLLYAPACTDMQIAALNTALEDIDLEPMGLRLGSLRSFDTVGSHAIHFRVRRNAALEDLQQQLYDLCSELGIQPSGYSNPVQYMPHITMGYAQEKPGGVTFNGKIQVEPRALHLTADDGQKTLTLHRKPCAKSEPASKGFPPALALTGVNLLGSIPNLISYHTDALDELNAWEKKERNGGLKAALKFRNYLVSDRVADAVRYALTQDNALAHEVFERARRVLTYKAVQATRLDFENDFEDLIGKALAGSIDRRTFGTTLRVMLNKYGRRAYLDGLADGGMEEPVLSDDDLAVIGAMLGEQSQYVTALGAAVYKEVAVSDAQAELKPAMWWNKSINPFYQAGMTSADSNGLYEFALGPTEEHCPDCSTLNGQRHRLKDWAKRALIPPTSNTTCGGWQCECKLVRVNGRERGAWL